MVKCIVFFFTHYTLHFTKKIGARKTAHEKWCAKRTTEKMVHKKRRVKNGAQKRARKNERAKMGTPKNRDRKMAHQKGRAKNGTRNRGSINGSHYKKFGASKKKKDNGKVFKHKKK